MTREEVESKWENLKCLVCGGEMAKESKEFALLSREFFSGKMPDDKNVFRTKPYACEDCGCSVFRKIR